MKVDNNNNLFAYTRIDKEIKFMFLEEKKRW